MTLHEPLPPPARLAVAYAPASVRQALALLLRLDARLADVAGAVREPLIGQIKLAWWRDAIAAPSGERPKGEPLLKELSQFDNRLLDQAATALIDAWEMLIVPEVWTIAAVERFAEARGRAVFAGFAQLAGKDYLPEPIASQWALDDLRIRFGNRVPDISQACRALPKDPALRPLTILALSVRQVSGPRLIWHALTGR